MSSWQSLAVLLGLVCVGSCGGGDRSLAPEILPPRIAAITVSGAAGISLRHGDSLQLHAVASDSSGRVVSGTTLVWSGGREGTLTVDNAGLVRAVRGSGFGTGFFVIKAEANGTSGSTSVWIRDWSFSKTFDPVSLDTTTYLSQGSSEGGLTLTIRCSRKNMKFEAYVSTGQITQDGTVTWRLSNGAPRTESWSESTDFRSLFYRGGDPRSFVAQLAAADTFFFQYRVFQSGTRSGHFLLRHMSDYTPKVLASCP